jgi:acyl-CoA synthetase (AMP-forming)/AMP-acid ligase II
VSTAHAAACLADPSAVGLVFPWIEAEVVDEADDVLSPGQEGWLRVRSDQMVNGYHRNDEATRRNFRDGWFYPGDRAAIAADRMLRITGRAEDVIVRPGGNVSPRPLEEAIRGVAGVRDVAVFSLPDAAGALETCAALVLEPGADAPAIRTAAAARLGDQAPARMFALDSLPRNAAGKVLRRELAEMARRSVKA